MKKEQLAENLTYVFKPLGFKKKGNYWVNNGTEITKMVNLQKSQYSNRFYINYGYIIKSIQLVNLMMHIFKGLGSIDVKENTRIQELLNLENNISDEIRASELKQFLSTIIAAEFETVNTEDDLLKVINNLPTLNMVPGVVKKHYNIE